jgi:hypothetical protein
MKYFMEKERIIQTASQSAFFRLFVRRRIEMNDKHQLLKLITLHHNNFFSFSLTCKAFFLAFSIHSQSMNKKQTKNEKDEV